MTTTIQRISFIGAGSMAGSIIKGLITKKMIPAKNISVTNRTNNAQLDYLAEYYNIQTTRNIEKLIKESDLIILAMKPKDAISGIERIRPYVTERHMIASVMAGITTSFIEKMLQKKCAVVRTMPNTSTEIGMSATTLCNGMYVSSTQSLAVQHLFQSIGSVNVVEEQNMDITTAIAGSGPAYIYYIAESMTSAARALDLDDKQTRNLIADTLIGAGHMLKQSKEDISQLRVNITSPGGTTAAGLDALMNRKVDEAFQQCIFEAAQRSKELQKQYSTYPNTNDIQSFGV